MKAHELATLVISLIALGTSLFSVWLQYGAVINISYRVNRVNLVSPEAKAGETRIGAILVSLSFYNLGNRSASIEGIGLWIEPGDFAVLSKNPPKQCGQLRRWLIPISKASFNQLSIEPFVVGKQDIAVRELVFDIFADDRESKKVRATGLICLNVVATDFLGSGPITRIPESAEA